MISYSAYDEVSVSYRGKRPILSTIQRGKVAIDESLLSLWRYAKGKSLDDIVNGFRSEIVNADFIRAGLACLAEADLLKREGETQYISEVGRRIKPIHDVLISAIIVGFNSCEWLKVCIPSLERQEYSRFEIIYVDNGSVDNSLEWVLENYPSIKSYRLDSPSSLSHAINKGVSLTSSKSSYYLFLNPDIELTQDAIGNMVDIAQGDKKCAAVAAKLRFSWAPAFLNGLGNRVGPFSWGTDNALGHLDLGQFDHWKELPSACFAVSLVNKDAWAEVGKLDEGFPMYYEDSEWSYRARSMGYKVLAAPNAVMFHAFGGSVPSGHKNTLSPKKLRNVVYGRIRFAYKIVRDDLLRYLKNYIIEDIINSIRYTIMGEWRSTSAYFLAWWDIIRSFPELLAQRKSQEDTRTVSDAQLFKLQRNMPETLSWNGLPELTWDIVVNHYLPLIRSGRTRYMPEFDVSNRKEHLLIVSNDVVDENMAGPGIRYLEMARALKDSVDVTLAIPVNTKLQIPGLRIVRYWENRPKSLQVLVENSDVALISGFMEEKFPFLRTTETRIIVDLYDPIMLENLFYYSGESLKAQENINSHTIEVINRLLELGDFFICGSERQKDFWMGFLAANGRVNPKTYKDDPSLGRLIDVVSIGIPDEVVKHKRAILRGVHDKIPKDAEIVLWGGGLWDWLDPLTLVEAWPKVLQRHPKARLVFLGTKHPNPLVPSHDIVKKTKSLAAEIGEQDNTIIFLEWVPYEDYESLLWEVDVGVVLHPSHIETRYSIRTRVFEYFRAHLPVLITEGDVTSKWIDQYSIGEVVPPLDVETVAQDLCDILSSPKEHWQEMYKPVQSRFRWSNIVEPLLNYCVHGGYAPDRKKRQSTSVLSSRRSDLFARALYILRNEGARELLHRVWRHLQWRMSRPFIKDE